MFVSVKEFINAKYLQGEISRSRADEIIGVVEFESKKIKSEQEFQDMINRITKTQFPELKDYFDTYRMKAGEWLDKMAVERVDKLIEAGKMQEAEMAMGILEEMEENEANT